MILILIHHIHLLMYVPTIAVIVVLRYYLVQGFDRQNVVVGIAAIAVRRPAVLGRAVLWDRWRCPRRSSSAICRAGWPIPRRTNLLSFSYIWYQPLSKEIHDTWARMPSNILGVPVFALLIWLHAPLWRYFADLIRSLVG